MIDKIIPFQTINWGEVPKTVHNGITGYAEWQTLQFNGLRVRKVFYSKDYLADHWCRKGHIVHCLQGELLSQLATGEFHYMDAGSTYVVSDNQSSHRSVSFDGATLLIIDGDFLN